MRQTRTSSASFRSERERTRAGQSARYTLKGPLSDFEGIASPCRVREFIDAALTQGGRVLVHCGDGISRSPAIVFARTSLI